GTQVSISNVVQGNLKPVAYSGMAELEVDAKGGADTFTVTPAATPMILLGGEPIGTRPGDALNITAGSQAVTMNAGPTADSGSFVVGANAPISYSEIESGTITGGAAALLTINGTTGND